MLEVALSSHVDDGVAKATLAMARCHCRVMLVIVLLSHADDGTAEVT
jgi:hypothetical protein